MTEGYIADTIKTEKMQEYLQSLGIDELKIEKPPNFFGIRFLARKKDTWASFTLSGAMLAGVKTRNANGVIKLVINELVKTFNSPGNPDWVLSRIAGEI